MIAQIDMKGRFHRTDCNIITENNNISSKSQITIAQQGIIQLTSQTPQLLLLLEHVHI